MASAAPPGDRSRRGTPQSHPTGPVSTAVLQGGKRLRQILCSAPAGTHDGLRGGPEVGRRGGVARLVHHLRAVRPCVRCGCAQRCGGAALACHSSRGEPLVNACSPRLRMCGRNDILQPGPAGTTSSAGQRRTRATARREDPLPSRAIDKAPRSARRVHLSGGRRRASALRCYPTVRNGPRHGRALDLGNCELAMRGVGGKKVRPWHSRTLHGARCRSYLWGGGREPVFGSQPCRR